MASQLAYAVALIVLLQAAPPVHPQADEAEALARRVLAKQKTRPFWFRMRSITFGIVPYVFDVKATATKYDGEGHPQKTPCNGVAAKGVFVPVDGVMLYTPNEGCGQPVSDEDRKSWERKNEETLSRAKRRSDKETATIRADEQKQQEQRALFWDEFLNAFGFQTLDHRIHNERRTTVVAFTPKPGFKPRPVVDAKYLPKLRGQIWIDDSDNEIVRFQIEFTDDVSAGFGLAGKVHAGTSYFMELSKQIDDRWLPVRAETVLRMRQLLVVKTNQKYTVEYSNYRKFSTDVRIFYSRGLRGLRG